MIQDLPTLLLLSRFILELMGWWQAPGGLPETIVATNEGSWPHTDVSQVLSMILMFHATSEHWENA